jgi:hypothetical protein
MKSEHICHLALMSTLSEIGVMDRISAEQRQQRCLPLFSFLEKPLHVLVYLSVLITGTVTTSGILSFWRRIQKSVWSTAYLQKGHNDYNGPYRQDSVIELHVKMAGCGAAEPGKELDKCIMSS